MPHFAAHYATGGSPRRLTGDWMAYVTSKADQVPSGRGISRSGTILLVIAGFALASGAAASLGGFDAVGWYSDSASVKVIDSSSFDDRFSVGSGPNLLSADIPSRSLVRSLPSELEIKFEEAKGQLAQGLQSQYRTVALIEEPSPSEEPRPSKVTAVPLPKSRPVEANLELKDSIPAAQTENRTLLQKISDLLPARIRLASLAPDGGLFRQGPDLASLGYDNVTAVYDISARAAYM